MKTLLVINSSPNQQSSVSRELANGYSRDWARNFPSGEVVERDLADTNLVTLDSATIAAFYTPAEHRDEQATRLLALSNELVAELQRADEIVIAAPMHNFSVPGSLKLWIDLICRVGVTFRYSDSGPVGLLAGKTATVITSRGGRYGVGTGAQGMNHQDPMLTTVLNFVGITDIRHVAAEGMASGDGGKVKAQQQLSELFG
ncbi:FMN-dependent NADH-azoreductase [Ferrimonas lipolytica]|uniref:FMN dependent NADH:quinone oxidoreductase n=1 Tax=Ferrimonas lipolytica TaxID=2724191 RepID=A0A6H1UBH5_9GAMM|nr:NAD(P)H-dependent oxidoreductase [Ferrimonas lipolytica]QIZ76437.1 FMN-dependent NADH-azoreductase [Ferrimonas lipolytica]